MYGRWYVAVRVHSSLSLDLALWKGFFDCLFLTSVRFWFFMRVSFLKKAVPSHIPVLYFTGLCALATTRRDVLSKVMCSLNSVRLPCFLPSRSPDQNLQSSAENCALLDERLYLQFHLSVRRQILTPSKGDLIRVEILSQN